jgi:hypothetical protein
MREYHLDFAARDIESAAALLTFLAYPEPEADEATLGNTLAFLCHRNLIMRYLTDEAWATIPQVMKPIYAFHKEPSGNEVRQLNRRLRDRIAAARMAVPFFQEVALGRMPKLPRRMKRLSLNQMSAFVMDDIDVKDPENIGSRIWRPSLPVIHLALATLEAADRLTKLGLSAGWDMLLANPELAKWIVDESEGIATVLLQSGRLSIEPEMLIRVRTS